MAELLQIEGKDCYIHAAGSCGPVIYWGTYLHKEDEIERLILALDAVISGKEYTLVAFLCDDWNRDFSPWESPAVFGDQSFDGKGSEMLSWLQEKLVPYISDVYGSDRERYLIGYSLAGLFALWAAYESALFKGIACCSGSLWFPEWDKYVSEHQIKASCSVYLSLGSKEEKTKNKTMALVGDRTRKQIKLLEQDRNIRKTVLEWNKGGHFSDPEKRLAKGVKWLLSSV